MKRFLNELYGFYTPMFDQGETGGQGGGDDEKDDKKPDDKTPKTFTQEDLDKVVTDRIARERKKFADYDELKTKLSALEKADEERKKADMTLQERLELEKKEAEDKARLAEESAQQTLFKANQRLVSAEFRLKAKELGIRVDAIDDAFKLADVSAVKVNEEGAVEGIDDVVKALIANKPFLLETKKEARNIGGASNPADDKGESAVQTELKRLADIARRTQRPEDVATYSAFKTKNGL